MRRDDAATELLMDHFDAVLASLFEFALYKLHLTVPPASIACLALDESALPDIPSIQKQVVANCREEWGMVVGLEKSTHGSKLLEEWCPYTRFQVYRELMVSLESKNWKVDHDFKERVLSYYPRWGCSANVEDCFAAMGDSVQRSGKTEMASLNNLQVTAIKSLYRACDKEGECKAVHVGGSDWEGPEIRNLKQSIYQSNNWAGSSLEATCSCMHVLLVHLSTIHFC